MPCVLRTGGDAFDVDGFLNRTKLDDVFVRRKGEARSTARPDELLTSSWVMITTSDAGFDEFDDQIAETIEFLRLNHLHIADLVNTAGLEYAELDFGVRWSMTYTHSGSLPAELIRLAGELGLSIAIPHYPISDPSEDE
jgi:hypothetical protein